MLYHLRLQPSEVENMPYYEYEYIVQNLIDILKEKQESEENQSRSYSEMDPNSVMKQAGKYIPNSSMNKAPNIKFPGIPSSLKI